MGKIRQIPFGIQPQGSPVHTKSKYRCSQTTPDIAIRDSRSRILVIHREKRAVLYPAYDSHLHVVDTLYHPYKIN